MNLIEPGVMNSIQNKLMFCHEKKGRIHGWIFNLIGYSLFFAIVSIVLYCCRKRRRTPYEEAEKMRQDQDYIMSKIKQYQTAKLPDNTSAITHLPVIAPSSRQM
jgi:preprotein translocase subunit SecY